MRGLGLDEIARLQGLYDVDNIFQRVANLLGIAGRLARDLERIHTAKFGLDRSQIMMQGRLYHHLEYTLKVTFARGADAVTYLDEATPGFDSSIRIADSRPRIQGAREKGKHWGRGPLGGESVP